jgi:hypothetical protein
VAGERGERERLNKFLCCAGHDDADVDSILLECADKFGGLVGSDSAADSDGYARHFSVHENPSPRYLTCNIQMVKELRFDYPSS